MSIARRNLFWFVVGFSLVGGIGLHPTLVCAHAFGSRYELPVPVWLFIFGGAATVTLTFILVYLFVRHDAVIFTKWRYDLFSYSLVRLLFHPWIVQIAKWIVVLLLLIVLIAGFVGTSNPNRNISPILVWVIWWVGFSYLSMLIGNIWPFINPWRTIFEFVQRFMTSNSGDLMSQNWRYPERLEIWPAVALLLVFAWIEQVYPHGADPYTLSIMASAYSAITWFGMYIYGVETWLKKVDPFHVAFSIYGRFAPISRGNTKDRSDGRRSMILHLYAARLQNERGQILSLSTAAFILALLSTVLFDGLLSSDYWVQFENFIHEINPKLGDGAWIAVHTVCLIGVWGSFLFLYTGTCWIMSWLSNYERSPINLSCVFALALIPIVIGYHFAHTFAYLLVQGQNIIFLISDPFGFGWNLFGSADYKVDLTLMKTKTVWYLAVTAIVAGHVVSIYFAHCAGVNLFSNRVVAFKCLTLLTILMVIYTIISLVILAEPLVKFSAPNEEIVLLLLDRS